MIRRSALIGVACLHLAACGLQTVERYDITPDALNARASALRAGSPFLKAHMKDGSMYLFRTWEATADSVVGVAAHYSPARLLVENGTVKLGYGSVALFESNRISTGGPVIALQVLGGMTLAVALICVATPKTCFGSCPTFYAEKEGKESLVAEGFSASVAPALEETDIDAIGTLTPENGSLTLRMKNEAMETHVIRWADLLAVPRRKDGRVLRDAEGKYWTTGMPSAPVSATAAEGECKALVSSADGIERFSLSDANDLAEKETIDLTFNAPTGMPIGLALTSRQTLLTTFLFYQTLAYMGTDAGAWLSRMSDPFERGALENLRSMLGTIEVFRVDGNGSEHKVAEFSEQGPLASDTRLFRLGVVDSPELKMRLRMTKGMWRVDLAGLVAVDEECIPRRLRPVAVLKNGKEDPAALAALLDSAEVLATLPGDVYDLQYAAPAEEGQEYFLESRGYYLEWMRDEWLRETDPVLLAEMFGQPRTALQRLAPVYKRLEPEMEDSFWRSRYAKP